MLRLSCPQHWLEQILRVANTPGFTGVWPLREVRHASGARELLVASTQSHHSGAGLVPSLRLQLDAELPADVTHQPPGQATMWLSPAGRWVGRYRPADTQGMSWPVRDMAELWLPGPGLLLLPSARAMSPTWATDQIDSAEGGSALGWLLSQAGSHGVEAAGSRSAHALGGWEVLSSLRSLRYGVVGLGRQGHAMVTVLGTYQPRSLLLIDPQQLEPGNLDAGLAFTDGAALGHEPSRKVDKLANWLRSAMPATRVQALAMDVRQPEAAALLSECDVIITTPDRDEPRLVCASIAAAYHRVHLDIGSLVSRNQAGRTQLGADVRLMLPGDRDLSCLGGFAAIDQVEGLTRQTPDATAAEPWWRLKAGALTSWAAVAGGLGMRLLEDLAAGRLQGSRWLRVTHDEGDAAPHVQALDAQRDPFCPLCAQAGKAGRIDQTLAELATAVVIRAHRRAAH